MKDTRHDTFTMEREFSCPRQGLFAAFTTRDSMIAWACPSEGMSVVIDPFDFREGGATVIKMTAGDVDPWFNEDRYHEIVPGRRIIQSTTLRQSGALSFAGVITFEFVDRPNGSLLRLTEQGAFPDGRDDPEMHKAGWAEMFERLAHHLKAR